ncbi:MAG: transposase [Bacteroidetes bacterium]|nr:transposase [Bacteroidota bacterium]
MDSFYPAAKLLKVIRKYKWHWIAKIKCNRRLNRVQVKKVFKYRYGNHVGRLTENIEALIVKDNDPPLADWATIDLSLNSTSVKRFYVNRQAIEEFFKILKSELRIATKWCIRKGCSARSKTAQANHIYFVLIAFCQLEDFRIKKNIKTIYHFTLLLFRFTIPKNFDWDIDPVKYA